MIERVDSFAKSRRFIPRGCNPCQGRGRFEGIPGVSLVLRSTSAHRWDPSGMVDGGGVFAGGLVTLVGGWRSINDLSLYRTFMFAKWARSRLTSRIRRRRAGGVEDTTDAIRAVACIRFVRPLLCRCGSSLQSDRLKGSRSSIESPD